jgi:hypothetical protein
VPFCRRITMQRWNIDGLQIRRGFAVLRIGAFLFVVAPPRARAEEPREH